MMRLEKHVLRFSSKLIEDAREELRRHELERSEDACVWGFFPGFEKQEDKLYPCCVALRASVDKHISSMGDPWNKLALSFIKIACSKPKVEFGGMHVDDSVSVENKNIVGRHILRLIINLGEHPRFLRYTELSAEVLRRQGVHISNSEYHPIELPSSVETKIIRIPPRTEGEFWSLAFWANETPHLGVTDENGYFIAGYGGYFDTRADL